VRQIGYLQRYFILVIIEKCQLLLICKPSKIRFKWTSSCNYVTPWWTVGTPHI